MFRCAVNDRLTNHRYGTALDHFATAKGPEVQSPGVDVLLVQVSFVVQGSVPPLIQLIAFKDHLSVATEYLEYIGTRVGSDHHGEKGFVGAVGIRSKSIGNVVEELFDHKQVLGRNSLAPERIGYG